MNKSDRDITQQIRKAIVGDKSLSTYAHNVKIITRNGQVTLKGPVRSDEEKSAVEQKATEVAGSGKVTNQITVAPSKSSKTKSQT
jgi:osmotically-inducible protein OsmY